MDSAALTMKLERALLDLGDTPDTVAAYLEAQGITGQKSQPFTCPVAQHLLRVTGCEAGVDERNVELYRDKPFEFASARVPRAVGQFIRRFDKGKYPVLEAKP